MPRACRGGGARTGLGPCVGASAGCSSVTTAAMCRVADVNEPLLAQREVSLPPVTERGVDPGGQFLIRSEARHSLPPRHLDRFGPEQATAGSRHVIILLGVQQLFGGRGARAARIAAVGLGRAARRAGPDAGRAATRSYSPAASRSNTLAPSSCTARSAAGGVPDEPRSSRRTAASTRWRCSSWAAAITLPLAQKCTDRRLTSNSRASWSHVSPLRRRNSAIAVPASSDEPTDEPTDEPDEVCSHAGTRVAAS